MKHWALVLGTGSGLILFGCGPKEKEEAEEDLDKMVIQERQQKIIAEEQTEKAQHAER